MIKLPLTLPYPEASTICDATGSSIAECIDNETARAIIRAFLPEARAARMDHALRAIIEDPDCDVEQVALAALREASS